MSSTTSSGSQSKQSIRDTVKNIWGKRDDGLFLPEDMFAKLPITHEQILYLLSLYPFLQIVSTEAESFYEDGPKMIASTTGWLLHDYGDAISTSLGMLLFMANEYHQLVPRDADEEDGGDEGGEGVGELKPGVGTIIKQAYDTAYEIILASFYPMKVHAFPRAVAAILVLEIPPSKNLEL